MQGHPPIGSSAVQLQPYPGYFPNLRSYIPGLITEQNWDARYLTKIPSTIKALVLELIKTDGIPRNTPDHLKKEIIFWLLKGKDGEAMPVGTNRQYYLKAVFDEMTSVDVSNCGLQDSDMNILWDGLRYSYTTNYLDLSFNDIGDFGAEIIADNVKLRNKDFELILKDNKIQAAGKRCIEDAARRNPNLRFNVSSQT